MFFHHLFTDAEMIRLSDRLEGQPIRALADRLELRSKTLATIMIAWHKIKVKPLHCAEDYSPLIDVLNNVDDKDLI